MRVSTLALICIVAIVTIAVAVVVDAHKSVRHIKPQTEEARSIHHHMENEQPPKEDGDHVFMREHLTGSEYHPIDHAHKSSRHKRWGPEHPNHIKHKQWHYKAPRMYEGAEIDDEIHDEDLHMFGISRHNELQG